VTTPFALELVPLHRKAIVQVVEPGAELLGVRAVRPGDRAVGKLAGGLS